MTKKKYELLPEHAAQMDGWRDMWIARAMRTAPMTDEDRSIMRGAIVGLYRAANLKPPPEDRIHFVPSPFYGACLAAAMAVDPPIPFSGVLAAFESHRADLTNGTRWFRSGAYAATCGAVAGKAGTNNYANHGQMMNGGNQWAGWPAWLSFMRHVCKLGESHGVDFSKWHHYELAAIHGGPRWMHEDFCVVSDFPVLLEVDDRNRPHPKAGRGPFCRWSDGTALYSWHGVRVPAWVMDAPETITVAKIKAERNAEVRRAMREMYGEGRYLTDSGAKLVDADMGGARAKGAAPRALLQDEDGALWLVGTDGSTGRTYYMKAPDGVKTCRAAHEALCGFAEDRILNAS